MTTITGNAANNVLTGDIDPLDLTDDISGLEGNDSLFGLTGNDFLDGGLGNDTLDGGTGDDHMHGGDGSDVYIVDSTGDLVHEFTAGAVGGTDRVQSSVSFTLGANLENLTLTGAGVINGTGNGLANTLIGNASANTLRGMAGNDTMFGGAGNDRLDGGTGNDHMHGEDGSDVYIVDSLNDVVHEFVAGAVGGTDRVESSVNFVLGANLENLTLTGAAAINGTGNELANSINGNSANNVLDGRAGNDHMHGFGGNDSYYVDSSADLVHESANQGTDTVFSRAASFTLSSDVENLDLLDLSIMLQPGGGILVSPAGINGTGNGMANVITGSAAANQLNGMGGNDNMHGEGGNDTLNGGTGDDHMGGGAGNDVYIVDSVNDFVHEENGVGGGIDRIESSVSLTLTDIDVENLTLTGRGNINGTGNAAANVINGNAANNVLNGLAGADTMSGGGGNDVYIVDNAADQAIESAGAGTDTVRASVTEVLTDVDVENLVLTGAGAINGTGNASANHIDGNSAANVLMGLGGNDLLHAGAGNDTVEGGTGADEIHGSTGIDTLRAVDNVTADDGAEDRFVFNSTPNAATNFDLIDVASFIAAGGEGVDDQIQLENSIFAALQSAAGTNLGTLGANYYREGAFLTGNGAADPIGIYNNTFNGQLFYNPTFGVAGDSVLFAVIGGGVPGGSAVLSAEEFTLG